MKNKLLSGAFWMMLGSILSRILGIVYLIPWLIMMGNPQHQNAAQAIFNTAYTPYALFLSLGTAGFPTAIARQVAEYNGQNKFKNSVRVFKFASLFMLFTGCTFLRRSLRKRAPSCRLTLRRQRFASWCRRW